MTPNVLANLQFQDILSEAAAQTKSGSDFLTKYQSYMLTHEASCFVVNNFLREGMSLCFDSAVKRVLEQVNDYIVSNRIGWMIASTCESIFNDNNQRNYLNRNAAKQAYKLLEMNEEDMVKYIKAGALKNIMFCESFRTIASEVFKDSVAIVERNENYTKTVPVSMVEISEDATYFVVKGGLYTIENNVIAESNDWNAVSDTFKIVESLLESNLVTVDEENLHIKYNNQEYTISEAGMIKHGEKEMTVQEMREENQLYLRTANPRRVREMDQVLEAIAVLCENYDDVTTMDNVSIYSNRNSQFMVIEAGPNMLAKSLTGTPWMVNENAMKTLDFIKSKTNINLSESYNKAVEKSISEASEASKAEMQATLENQSILSIKERIELLTEKFKRDPAKLAVLAKLASEIGDI